MPLRAERRTNSLPALRTYVYSFLNIVRHRPFKNKVAVNCRGRKTFEEGPILRTALNLELCGLVRYPTTGLYEYLTVRDSAV